MVRAICAKVSIMLILLLIASLIFFSNIKCALFLCFVYISIYFCGITALVTRSVKQYCVNCIFGQWSCSKMAILLLLFNFYLLN